MLLPQYPSNEIYQLLPCPVNFVAQHSPVLLYVYTYLHESRVPRSECNQTRTRANRVPVTSTEFPPPPSLCASFRDSIRGKKRLSIHSPAAPLQREKTLHKVEQNGSFDAGCSACQFSALRRGPLLLRRGRDTGTTGGNKTRRSARRAL